jgi:alkylation response protein AidB-like acyl-CoA dehydrogenase
MTMDWNALSDDEFRNQLRDFFAANVPEHLRSHPHRIPRWSVTKGWYQTLAQKGWLAPNWPREHGGMGLDLGKRIIYFAEIERGRIPRLYDMGIYMFGPLLIQHGSEEQKRHYLPKILSGEHLWAQGYSEPGAGSDLASLRMTASLDGDVFILNGQKLWSTFLDDATHMYLLARTASGSRKQDGISVIIVDLASVGITRRLIKTLAGQEELGEVFFDDVRMPATNLVGPLHRGWGLAKDLLEFERLNNGSPKLPLSALNLLVAYGAERGLLEDPRFAGRLTRLRMDLEDQITAYRYFGDLMKAGNGVGPEVSILKIWSTETFQRLADLFLDIAGEDGIEAYSSDDDRIGALRMFFNSRPATIYAGCNEVQRDVVAKRVLQLPG